MYNTGIYNTSLYNVPQSADSPTGGAGAGYTSELEQISFNGFVFDGVVIPSRFNRDNTAKRTMKTTKVPRSSGRVILRDEDDSKIIRIAGSILTNSKNELDQKLHEFKNKLLKRDGILKFPDNGVVRQIKCNWINGHSAFDREANYEVSHCDYVLEFEATDVPYIQDLAYSSETLYNQTDSELSMAVSVDGSARETFPILVMIFSAGNNISNIKFENLTRNESIDIDFSVSPSGGDVLIIDSETRSVSLNGTELDYNGFFPSLQYGSNLCKIAITGTSATYSPTIKFKNNFA